MKNRLTENGVVICVVLFNSVQSGQSLFLHQCVVVVVANKQHRLLQQKKGRGTMKERRQNSKLKKYGEEEMFRMKELHGLRR